MELPVDEKIRLLLVEDDRRLSTLIREYLGGHGFAVAEEGRGDRAVERIVEERPDLVVLDLMLPGMDGFEVCRAVRPAYGGPILMLTARDEEMDQVVGLELGADDYVTKPVQPRLLLARLRALLRRGGGEARAAEQLRFGRLEISSETRDVHLEGRAIPLGTGEFELLWALASRVGEVLGRDELLRRMRGIDYDGLDRSVDIAVSRLRRKLGVPTNGEVGIKTVRGRGYLFAPDFWRC